MSVGLFSKLMSSLGMTSARKWTPQLTATRVVMMEVITQWAKTMACE